MTADWIPARGKEERIALSVRAGGLLAVAAMTLAFPAREAFAALTLVFVIAVLASTATLAKTAHTIWILAGEAVLTAIVAGVSVPSAPQPLLYLLVPVCLGGLAAGVITTASLTAIEVVVIIAAMVTRQGWDFLATGIEMVGPWLLTSLGAGTLGAWVRQLQGNRPAEDDAYDSARRLLAQLRTVARRLSAGLDPVGIASQILVEVHDAIDDECSVLLVRSEGGALVPLALRGPDRLSDIGIDDPLVMECWTHEVTTQQSVDDETGTRIALPLQVGARMLGVVVANTLGPPTSAALQELRAELGQHSIRLDTALIFDEVRTIATADERRRLAREIHDGIAQEVASLGYVVDELVATAESDGQKEGLRDLRSELTRLVSELRLSIFDLRSEITSTDGFSAVLSDYVRTVGSRSGMTVHLSLNETPHRLRVEVETEILRIAQEAVTNARRHSGASNLWVTFAADPPHATLTVTDDGHGLGEPREDSYGLRIMRERANRIAASLMIASRPEGGTIVDLTLNPPAHDPKPAGTITARKESTDAYIGPTRR